MRTYILWLWLAMGLLICSSVAGVNHMDLLTTMSGEFIGSKFGASVVSMDFNGDGYDDLIVKSPYWNPFGTYIGNQAYGKLYFYWGGPNFDNIPDFVIEGQMDAHYLTVNYAGQMVNGGDVNGDGIDDLVTPQKNLSGQNIFGVYFGRSNPLSVPDVEIANFSDLIGSVYPMGNIDSDNMDEFSLSIYFNGMDYLLICNDIWSEPYLFRTTNCGTPSIVGVHDVNNDGIDDCYLTLPNYNQGSNHLRHVLFYGGETFPQTDSLVIHEDIFSTFIASPVGDVNNDGFADFIGYNSNLWLGSANLTSTPSLTLTINNPNHFWGNLEYNAGIPVIYGDLNGDGYDDFIGTNHDIQGYSTGEAAIWLGNSNVNGIIDLYINAPDNNCNYGFSKAAGDFNGDGCCDIAVSALFWGDNDPWITPGKVHIFSGNAALIDTTVDAEDEYISPVSCLMEIYPNPIHRQQTQFNLKLSGTGFRRSENLSVQMFNIKGQFIRSWELTADDSQDGIYNMENKGLAAGVYLVRESHGMESPICRKLVIL